MTAQQELVANAVLTKVLQHSFFSICEMTTLCDALNVPSDSPSMEALKALHCIDYKNFSPPLRRELLSMMKQAIRATDEEWNNILNPKWILDTEPSCEGTKSACGVSNAVIGWKKLIRLGF